MKDLRNRWVAEAAALLLPILIVAGPFLFTHRSLQGREFQATFRSHAAYAREMTARDGEWPRWNARQDAGRPYLGDLQGSLHYPPNLLFLAVAPERAFGFLFVFHMIVAAIGMYRLCRYFEFRRSAAVLGGTTYGVCFSAVAHMAAGTLPHFVTPALAPWVLLLLLRMVKRISMFRLVLLAVVIGAVLLGGSPQDVPVMVLLCVGLLAWTAIDAHRRKRTWKKVSLLPIALATAMGVALAFASIYPALEVREFAVAAFIPAGVARDWRVLYVGVLPTVVAFLPFQSPKRGPTLFFAVSAAVALLPPLLAPRAPACTLWVVALSLAGLAAAGWDGLGRGRYAPRMVIKILAVLGGVGVVAAGVASFRWKVLAESAILLGFLGISALIVTRLRTHPRSIVPALLLTAADLCFFDAREVRTLEPEEVAPPPWYAAHIGPEREEHRLLDLTTNDAGPAAHGFRLLNGYGYPRLRHLTYEQDRPLDLNVRWIVSSGTPPGERWKEIARRDTQVLYEAFSPKRSAFFAAPDDGTRPALNIHRSANSIEVGGRTYQPQRLVISESWMPGWKAFLARREVPVEKSSNGLMIVDVPAGDWYVTLRYEPDSYRVGRVVSSSAVAFLIGLLVAGMKRSKIAIS